MQLKKKYQNYLIGSGILTGSLLFCGLLYWKRGEVNSSLEEESDDGKDGLKVIRVKSKERPNIPDDHIPTPTPNESIPKPDTSDEGKKSENDIGTTPATVKAKKTWNMRKRLEYGDEDVLLGKRKPILSKDSCVANTNSSDITPKPSDVKIIGSSTHENSKPSEITAPAIVVDDPNEAHITNIQSYKPVEIKTADPSSINHNTVKIESPVVAKNYDPLPPLKVLNDYEIITSLDSDLFLASSTDRNINSNVNGANTNRDSFYLVVKLTFELNETLYLVRKTPLEGVLVPTGRSACGRLLFFPINLTPSPKAIRGKDNYGKKLARQFQVLNGIARSEFSQEDKCRYRRQTLNTLTTLLNEDVRIDEQHPIRIIQMSNSNGQVDYLLLAMIFERKKALRMETKQGEELRGIFRTILQLYPLGDDAMYVLSYFGSEEFKQTRNPPSDHYINFAS